MTETRYVVAIGHFIDTGKVLNSLLYAYDFDAEKYQEDELDKFKKVVRQNVRINLTGKLGNRFDAVVFCESLGNAKDVERQARIIKDFKDDRKFWIERTCSGYGNVLMDTRFEQIEPVKNNYYDKYDFSITYRWSGKIKEICPAFHTLEDFKYDAEVRGGAMFWDAPVRENKWTGESIYYTKNGETHEITEIRDRNEDTVLFSKAKKICAPEILDWMKAKNWKTKRETIQFNW